VLPFGDSITFGIGFDGGYRVELFTKAVNAGQKITFVGDSQVANGPAMVAGMPFPRLNGGYSGFTIAGITADGTFNKAFTTTPDIVLLHIGTNDIGGGGPQGMRDRLSMLIDKIVMRAPNALVVVAQIIPLQTATNQTLDTFNSLIPALVQMKADQGKHVVIVDMHTGFMVNMLGDGVHPNQTGYALMGDRWYSVISSYLPK
jgi:lysophospholipase L1-like esterase